MDAPLGHELQAGLEIALLGPADVADGIVLSAPLVRRLVAARPVGAGVTNLDLLAVKNLPLQIDLRVADDDEAAAIAQRFGGLLDRRIARRGSTQNDGVHAIAFAPGADFIEEVGAAGD